MNSATKWNAGEIKKLRQRLGWSLADFSRHFSVAIDSVSQWESGQLRPTPDDMLVIEKLEFHLHSYSEQVMMASAAERILKKHDLSQIDLDQLKKLDT